MDPTKTNDAVVEIFGEQWPAHTVDVPKEEPRITRVAICPACRLPFRGAGDLCPKCEEECFFCANCGEEKGEFICTLCARRKVPHCTCCLRPPLAGGALCAVDAAALEKEAIVGAAVISAVKAPEYDTGAAFEAEMQASHARANPYGAE